MTVLIATKVERAWGEDCAPSYYSLVLCVLAIKLGTEYGVPKQNRTPLGIMSCVIWHMLNVFKEGTRPSTYFKNNTHILWRVQRDYGCIHNSITMSYKIYER